MAVAEETASSELEPFVVRAADAEARLDKLEVDVQHLREGAAGESLLEGLYQLRKQLETALVEQKEAFALKERLKSENAKMTYRIKHLVSALRETGEKAGKVG